MKNYVKDMNKDGEELDYLRKVFLKLSDAKSRKGNHFTFHKPDKCWSMLILQRKSTLIISEQDIDVSLVHIILNLQIENFYYPWIVSYLKKVNVNTQRIEIWENEIGKLPNYPWNIYVR